MKFISPEGLLLLRSTRIAEATRFNKSVGIGGLYCAALLKRDPFPSVAPDIVQVGFLKEHATITSVGKQHSLNGINK